MGRPANLIGGRGTPWRTDANVNFINLFRAVVTGLCSPSDGCLCGNIKDLRTHEGL